MAVDTQSVTPSRSYQPYERPPQAATLWTAIPRGILHFTASRQLDAKMATDSALLTIPAVLEPNYGWVLAWLEFTIVQNRAGDWDDRTNLNLQNFYRQGETGLNANYRMRWLQSSKDGQTRCLVPTDVSSIIPTFPMLANEGTAGIAFNFTAWNNDVVNPTTVGTLDFIMAWWQFDLEQMRKFPINSPLPVQVR